MRYSPNRPLLNMWNSLTHVVQLDQIMRQDPEEVNFLECLKRLRKLKCTEDDYDMLLSRLVGSPGVPSLSSAHWQNALFIVNRHTLRRAISAERAKHIAASSGKCLFILPAYYSSTQTITASDKQA